MAMKKPSAAKRMKAAPTKAMGKKSPAKRMTKDTPTKRMTKNAPTKKALKGGQSRLPVELQKEILASPGKMLKASAMKMYGKMMKKK